MLTYALEKNGSSSLYTQLYGCIRRDILSGALQAGSGPASGGQRHHGEERL